MLRKKVVRHIKNNLSNFSYSDEYDEEQIKTNFFLREQF